jgi:hypothetical protein
VNNLLYLIVKNPFTSRDFQRLGVQALEQHFEVRILDCTAWLMPKAFETRASSTMTLPNLRAIASLREFKEELSASSGGLAVDYVGPFSVPAILLFHALKTRGIKLIVMDSGAYPEPQGVDRPRSFGAKIVNAIKNRGVQRHLNALIIKSLVKCLRDQTPDYAFVSGTSWVDNPRFSRAAIRIPAHSFDYETYLEIRARPAFRHGGYAVYLDEDIADHEDNVEMGFTAPVSAGRFFGALSRFFGEFETVSGMPVVVASYPTERAGRAAHFDGREVILGETAALIQGAAVVFAHASTAISFAVSWRRPLVFLTSHEMASSWYQSWIDAPRRILKCPLVNIDTPGQIRLEEWQQVDRGAYALYEDTYMKSKDSPDVSLWTIFLAVKAGDRQGS